MNEGCTAAITLAADLQLESSEVEIEDQDDHVDVEAEDEEQNVKEEAEVEVSRGEISQLVEEDEEGESTKPIIQLTLKIRVKLPASNAYQSNHSPGTAIPEGFAYIPFKRTSRRRSKTKNESGSTGASSTSVKPMNT